MDRPWTLLTVKNHTSTPLRVDTIDATTSDGLHRERHNSAESLVLPASSTANIRLDTIGEATPPARSPVVHIMRRLRNLCGPSKSTVLLRLASGSTVQVHTGCRLAENMTQTSYAIKADENYNVQITQERTTKKCFNITVTVRQKFQVSPEQLRAEEVLQAHLAAHDFFPRNAQCVDGCENQGKTERTPRTSGLMKLSGFVSRLTPRVGYGRPRGTSDKCNERHQKPYRFGFETRRARLHTA
eukprot:1183398-Prorocentrum_minimum.AAC.2